MHQFILEYYRIISSLFGTLASPVRDLADAINLPLVSVLLFGILGATAPCQLSTSVAALAFLTRGVEDDTRKLWRQTLAFVLGKLTVYLVVGGLIVAFSLQLSQMNETVIPVVVLARRLMGPLLVVIGLFMLGLLKLRISTGERVSNWLYGKIGHRKGVLPAYLLGVAFSFTFCPTLFWLFFGLTIPLAVASPGGVIFPGVFALGTVLPVLALAFLLFRTLNVRQIIRRFQNYSIWIQRIAAIIFVLVGINELILYWFI